MGNTITRPAGPPKGRKPEASKKAGAAATKTVVGMKPSKKGTPDRYMGDGITVRFTEEYEQGLRETYPRPPNRRRVREAEDVKNGDSSKLREVSWRPSPAVRAMPHASDAAIYLALTAADKIRGSFTHRTSFFVYTDGPRRGNFANLLKSAAFRADLASYIQDAVRQDLRQRHPLKCDIKTERGILGNGVRITVSPDSTRGVSYG